MTRRRRLILAAVALLVAIATAAVVSGVLVHDSLGRATSALGDHLWPAAASLGAVMTGVGNQRLTCLAESAGPPGGSVPQAQRELLTAAAEMRNLQGSVQPFTDLRVTAGRMAANLDTWSGLSAGAAGGTSGAGCGAYTDQRLTGPGAVALGDLSLSADHVATLLHLHTTAESAAAADAQDAVRLHAIATAGALFALALGVPLAVSRFSSAQTATIGRRLREIGRGVMPGGAAETGEPSLGQTLHTLDRIEQDMTDYRRAARRSREAVAQEGQTALGVNRILTARGRSGPGVDAYGDLIPAEGMIAGDFFDVQAMPDGRTALLVGDVSGHGVAAGLLAVQVKAAVISELRRNLGADAAVLAAHAVLAEEDERFVTLIIAILDPAGAVTWLNAGHGEPFVRTRDGRVERLPGAGPLISGVIRPDGATWPSGHRAFAPGELLLLVTDGIGEARDAAGTQFGDQGVIACLHHAAGPDPEDAVQRVRWAVERHAPDDRHDDVTLLAATVSARGTTGHRDGANRLRRSRKDIDVMSGTADGR